MILSDAALTSSSVALEDDITALATFLANALLMVPTLGDDLMVRSFGMINDLCIHASELHRYRAYGGRSGLHCQSWHGKQSIL